MRTFGIGVCAALVFYVSDVAAFAGLNHSRGDLTTQDLEISIQENKIKTMESLLLVLPEDLRSNHILVYRTGSPQWATPTEPRVILSSKDASLLLAYNGQKSGSAAFQTVDILEFDRGSEVYLPRTIKFFPDGSTQGVVDYNPKTCFSCHTSHAGVQPIVRTYMSGIYPGLYGSVEGQILGLEKSWFNKFKEIKPWHPRYSMLPDQGGADIQKVGQLILSKVLKGIAKKIARQKELYPFRYALLAALECSPRPGREVTPWGYKIEDYVSKIVLDQFQVKAAEYAGLLVKRQKDVFNSFALRRAFFLDGEGVPEEVRLRLMPGELAQAPDFSYLLRHLLKDELVYQWRSYSVELRDGAGGLLNLAEPLAPLLLDSPEDNRLIEIHNQSKMIQGTPYDPAAKHGPELCKLLKERSQSQW